MRLWGLLAERFAKSRHASTVFAKLLEEYIISTNPEKPLPANIYNKIETAVSIRNAAAASKRVDLDKQGTRLWNLSSKLKDATMDRELLCLSKTSLAHTVAHADLLSSRLRFSSTRLRSTMHPRFDFKYNYSHVAIDYEWGLT